MKNIKQIIKEELNEDEFISLITFQNRLCDKQKNEAPSLYNKILNNSKLNWFLLKNNKYEKINILHIANLERYIIWYDGTWHDGEWKNGYWNNGVWYNGIWNDGIWCNGTWENGEWKDGQWRNGTWVNGKWKYGS